MPEQLDGALVADATEDALDATVDTTGLLPLSFPFTFVFVHVVAAVLWVFQFPLMGNYRDEIFLKRMVIKPGPSA